MSPFFMSETSACAVFLPIWGEGGGALVSRPSPSLLSFAIQRSKQWVASY